MAASEIDMYRSNVPYGDGKFQYADWTSAQNTVTLTAATSINVYVNRLRFIAAQAWTLTVGSFTIAGNEFSHQVDSVMELYTISDPYLLNNVTNLEGANDYIVGEIKFNPPIYIATGSSFTITANTLTKSGALHWAIEYWEVPST